MRHHLLLATLLAAAAVAALYLAQPAGSGLVVEITGLDRLGAAYGTIQLIPTGPGGLGDIVTVEYRGGDKVTARVMPPPLGKGGGDAAALTVVLNLYTREGKPLIASRVYTSYEEALQRFRDPQEAYRAVKRDPLYLFHSRRVLVVDAAKLLSPQQRGKADSSTWTPLGCRDVVTVDNLLAYQERLGLRLQATDLVAIRELYESRMPRGFAERLRGAPAAEVYNVFKKRLSTSVLVPASCGDPVGAAVAAWHRLPPGFYKMRDALSRLTGRSLDWHVERKTWVTYSPLAFLEASCGQSCDNEYVQLRLSIGKSGYRNYVNGITVMGNIIVGYEDSVFFSDVTGDSLTPKDASRHCVVIIMGHISHNYLDDGLYMSYKVEKVSIYSSRLNRVIEFWKVSPQPAFTPIIHDELMNIRNTLNAYRLCPDTHRSLYNDYYLTRLPEQIGATRYTERKIYERSVNWFDSPSEIIDVTASNTIQDNSGTLAAAVYGIAFDKLKSLLLTVAAPSALQPLVDIAGSFITYAYSDTRLSMTTIKLSRSAKPPAHGEPVKIAVYRLEPLNVDTGRPPLLMGYRAVFNPVYGGPPPRPPRLPTDEPHG